MQRTSDLSIVTQHLNWDSVPIECLEEGIQRQMIIGNQLMVCRLRFEPFVVTPAHDHPHEQITLVERGRVRFTIGSQERIAEAGDILHFPSRCWHGATMLDEEVILIDIFTPLREDFLGVASLKEQVSVSPLGEARPEKM